MEGGRAGTVLQEPGEAHYKLSLYGTQPNVVLSIGTVEAGARIEEDEQAWEPSGHEEYRRPVHAAPY